MKRMKKRCKFLMHVLLVLMFLVSSTVVSLNSYAETGLENEINDYVFSQLGGYLGGVGVTGDKPVYITQGFKVKNTAVERRERSYFVFEKDEIVGQLDVALVDSNWISSFVVGDFDYLTDFLKEGSSIAVYQEEGGRTINTKDKAVMISGKQRGKRSNSRKDVRTEKIKKQDVSQKLNFKTHAFSAEVADDTFNDKKETKNVPINRDFVQYEYDYNTTPHSAVNFSSEFVAKNIARDRIIEAAEEGAVRYVDVGFVSNTTIDGEGLCWAASGASIINYKKGTNLNATTIYNTLESTYNDTPSGVHYWISKMWSQYGVTMTHKYHKLSYSTINEQLLAQKPIFCCLYNANTSNGHSVVLVGTYTQSGTVFYVYMDPSTTDIGGSPYLVINSIVASTVNTTHTYTFYYYAYGNYYNNWFESYY